MGRGRRKRTFAQVDTESHSDAAGAAASAQCTNDDAQNNGTTNVPNLDQSGDWQVVKRQKQLHGNYPSITHSANARLHNFVKVDDLQNLCLYVLADAPAPQWCAVRHHANVKKVVVLLVPGLESGMFDGKIVLSSSNGGQLDARSEEPRGPEDFGNSEESSAQEKQDEKPLVSPDDYYPVALKQDQLPVPLQPLGDLFSHLWPIQTPGDDKYSRISSPLTTILQTSISKKGQKHARDARPSAGAHEWRKSRTPITEFLASTAELVDNGYVLHPAHYEDSQTSDAEANRRVTDKTTAAEGWVDTPGIPTLSAGDARPEDIEDGSVTNGRRVLALDCEMCVTSPPGEDKVLSLTRVTLIDWDGTVLIEELVKPAEPITDYATKWSGITADMLKDVTTTLADVQQKLQELITPQTILIGHSLESDLRALKLTHPFVVDTALIFPHPRGPPLKSALKYLAQKHLSREIQKGDGVDGHDSFEDAKACLDLVKLKCERGKAWATPEANTESIFRRIGRVLRPHRDRVGGSTKRISALVDWGDPTRGFGAHADLAIGCESDADVVEGVKRAIGCRPGPESTPSALVPDETRHDPWGGHDFIWARFRELEAFRGWWNRSKTPDNHILRMSAQTGPTGEADEATLADVVAQTVRRIVEVHDALPKCSVLIVYSGTGDPRGLAEMHALQHQFRQEYRTKKWDELSVKWTDVEEQKLKAACRTARQGIGLMTVK